MIPQDAVEEPLRESEASLRALVDRLPIGVLRTTPDGRFLHANVRLAHMLGYASVEELSERRADELYADPAARLEWLARAAQGETVRGETHALRKDGTPVAVRFSIAPARDRSGRLLWLDGAIEDVTHERRAVDALREGTALLQGVFDSLDDAVIVVSWPERRIVRINRACEAMYGLRQEDVVGRTTEVFHVDEAHFQEFGRRIAEKFARKEPARIEFRMRRSNGEIFPAESTTRLLLSEDGRVVAGIAVTRDLSDAKRQQADLEAARRGAAQAEKLAAMGQLVAGVAHEIRTPLAYIANHAHLLRRGATPAQREHADAIVEGTERIDRLVSSLRRFTREPPRAPVTVDVAALVEEATALFRATHPAAPPVRLALAAQAFARGSRGQLEQVVLNLLENAHEATQGAEPVDVRVLAEPDEVVLIVEDAGAGVDPATAARMWEPFFTTKAEGTGLGLAIVRRIVESHGGSIACDRGGRGGARFRVGLPRASP